MRIYLAETKDAEKKSGIIVASGWKAKNNIIRLLFRNSVTNQEGKRVRIEGGVTFNSNDTMIIVPVKNKKSERSPDYVALAFPEESK